MVNPYNLPISPLNIHVNNISCPSYAIALKKRDYRSYKHQSRVAVTGNQRNSNRYATVDMRCAFLYCNTHTNNFRPRQREEKI